MLRPKPIASLALLLLPLLGQADAFSDTMAQIDNVDITLKILFLMTVLALVPSILITVTSFTRIVIVLSLLRHALGIPQAPPNQVIVALSLFLTIFVMKPVYEDIDKTAIQPYLKKELTDIEALKKAEIPLKKFMLANTQQQDLKLFVELSDTRPATPDELGLITLIPAFMVSEIRVAFEIVFIIFLPFLIIDLLIASILMSMGMMMIPPVLISLPFKLILFVLSDGWELLVRALIESYHV